MVTQIFGVESSVEAKQFLMVSHFEGMRGTFHGFYLLFNLI